MSIIVIFAVIAASLGMMWWHNQSQNAIARKISDQELIEMARENNGELTKGYLVTQTGLTAAEANLKIQEFLNNGILHYRLGTGFRIVYKLDRSLMSGKLPKRPERKVHKVEQPQGYSDGDVISLAVKQRGKLSAAALCMKANIPIDEADKRLKDLQENGVFEIQVDDNGAILYVLNDMNLLD